MRKIFCLIFGRKFSNINNYVTEFITKLRLHNFVAMMQSLIGIIYILSTSFIYTICYVWSNKKTMSNLMT